MIFENYDPFAAAENRNNNNDNNNENNNNNEFEVNLRDYEDYIRRRNGYFDGIDLIPGEPEKKEEIDYKLRCKFNEFKEKAATLGDYLFAAALADKDTSKPAKHYLAAVRGMEIIWENEEKDEYIMNYFEDPSHTMLSVDEIKQQAELVKDEQRRIHQPAEKDYINNKNINKLGGNLGGGSLFSANSFGNHGGLCDSSIKKSRIKI